MSIVFDARKNADRSKRAREASARTPQLPGTAPDSADPQNAAPRVNPGNEPARPATKPNQTSTGAAATGTHAPTTHAPTTIAAGPDTPSRSAVDLKAERRSTDWRLRWNRSCAVNAIRGRLSIEDGAARKQLDLDIAELKSGSIVYAPVTNEVFFRLEIIRPKPEETLSESVRVVAGGIAARSSPEQNRRAPFVDKNGVARIARSSGAWAPGMEMRSGTGMTNETAQADAPLVRSLLRAPYPQAIPSVMGSSVPGSSVRGPSAPAPSAPAPSPRGASVANSSAKRSSIRDSSVTGGADFAEENNGIEPATLIARTDPVYPAIARQSHISGSVEVQFRISPEGRVYDVKSLKGWPILAKAAIDAVATWRYKPARRNGRPVESQVRTNFDFQMN